MSSSIGMVTFKIYGKRLQFANLKMAIEIVDFRSYKMVDLSIVMGQFTRGYSQQIHINFAR